MDFGGLRDKAESLIREHSDKVEQGIDKVGEFAGNKFGDDKVDPIEQKLHGFVRGLGQGGPAAPAAE